MTNNIFYTAQGILSYKRLYNFIMGVRGHGKTYDTTKRAIDKALEQKKITFVVLTRYKEDIKIIKDSWWCIVEHLYLEYKFSCIGRVIYADNGLERIAIGEYVAISEYTRVKRVPRPYVKYIIFDEVLNEDNDYLPDEVNKFLSVCDSIIRLRDDVRVILISNMVSVCNPYFDYFGFSKFDKRFTKGEHNSILEFTDSEDFINYRETTKFGSSIVGTSYGDYAIQGKFLLDDTTNVYKNPNGTYNYLYNLVLEGMNISVSLVNNLLYFAESKDFTRRKFTPYVDDAKNYGAMYCEKKCKHFNQIRLYFLNDKVMYESLKIKNAIILMVRYIMGNRQ